MGAATSGASAFTKTIGVQAGKQIAKTTGQKVAQQSAKAATATAAKVKRKIHQAATARGRENEGKTLKEEGLTKNKEKMPATDPKTGKTVNTIPDAMKDGGTIEVNDRKVLNDCPKLRAQSEISAINGQKATVYTGTNTQVSGTVENRMTVIKKDNLGPQN